MAGRRDEPDGGLAGGARLSEEVGRSGGRCLRLFQRAQPTRDQRESISAINVSESRAPPVGLTRKPNTSQRWPRSRRQLRPPRRQSAIGIANPEEDAGQDRTSARRGGFPGHVTDEAHERRDHNRRPPNCCHGVGEIDFVFADDTVGLTSVSPDNCGSDADHRLYGGILFLCRSNSSSVPRIS